ncbi:MAG TPA: lasso peptide biosynthesis B2 protein [Thermoanaerobaculia bacterium]|nr:lasso peptide biosynthesis B2 protein [Thermoanaerobaculia bacterium]
MRTRLRSLLNLPRGDWPPLALSWLLLLLADLGLAFLPLPTLQTWLARLALISRRFPFPASTDPRRLPRLVDLAAQHHLRAVRCLGRSLVLQALLAAQGLSAELQIGVRRGQEGIEAHAWVEHAGQAWGRLEDTLGIFHPLTTGSGAG